MKTKKCIYHLSFFQSEKDEQKAGQDVVSVYCSLFNMPSSPITLGFVS